MLDWFGEAVVEWQDTLFAAREIRGSIPLRLSEGIVGCPVSDGNIYYYAIYKRRKIRVIYAF